MRALVFRPLLVLGAFLALGSVTTLIPERSARRTARTRLNRVLARLLSASIGLRIETSAPPIRPERSRNGRILLANHVSILDVIAIASLEDSVFVTSRDVAESLPIRWLATIGGAVFVERRNRDRRTEELAELESILREGRTIVLFPEATSTDGSGILRFRSGLLRAAFRVPEIEIVPVCLQYRAIGGDPVSTANRDRILLYDEISIPEHLSRIFANPSVSLEARYLAPFPARNFEDAPALAAHAEFLVRSAYRPIKA